METAERSSRLTKIGYFKRKMTLEVDKAVKEKKKASTCISLVKNWR